MKRLVSFFLVLVILLSITACGGVASETTPTTEEPEQFITTTLIQDAASTLSIVHDGTKEAASLASQLKKVIVTNFGITPSVSQATEQANGTEIIVGNARPVVQKTFDKLRAQMDFAVKVEENALVLCAVDVLSYEYLGEYINEHIFVKNETCELTLDSDDNFIFSHTAHTQKNYIEYMQECGVSVSIDKLFAREYYKNADTLLPYRIYIPFNYSPEKQYPLLVGLHGAGLRGEDNEKQLKFIDTLLLQTDLELDDAIIIFPQCPTDQRWVDTAWAKGSYSVDNTPESNELRAVVELVQELMEKYPVDKSRVYACGFSMGGFGTWDLLMRHPDLFCAGVPMCGAGDPSKASVFQNIPVWAIHGAQDPTVPVRGSQEMIQAIEAAGITNAKYTELPEHAHDVWNYTYTNRDIFQWLFAQKKTS